MPHVDRAAGAARRLLGIVLVVWWVAWGVVIALVLGFMLLLAFTGSIG